MKRPAHVETYFWSPRRRTAISPYTASSGAVVRPVRLVKHTLDSSGEKRSRLKIGSPRSPAASVDRRKLVGRTVMVGRRDSTSRERSAARRPSRSRTLGEPDPTRSVRAPARAPRLWWDGRREGG